jgi:excisionase family DNA binding protein
VPCLTAEPNSRRPAQAAGSSLATALIASMSDLDLDLLAARLAPRLTAPVEDGWLRGADHIAKYIDCPRSRVYALVSARRIPIHRDGTCLLARRAELDAWVRDGGGRRP